MNTRSLRFQLAVWYAGLLTCCFIFFGAAAYIALRSYLVGALKKAQARRSYQIGQLVLEETRRNTLQDVGAELENRYAPAQNDRFVRISKSDGQIVYASGVPANRLFSPSDFPAPVWPSNTVSSRRYFIAPTHEMLIAQETVKTPEGGHYLVEAGALMDDVNEALKHWLVLLVGGLPIFALVALGGGYILVSRALRPVDQIALTAERIGSHNAKERLPVPQTGDELERLSVTLNRMIERLEEALQHSRRFMADASHELRTPLTVLRGELESCVQEADLPSEFRERLGSALDEVERLVNIVQGLFAISRLDAGEAQAEWVKFDLATLAASTADQMSLLGEDKHIRLTCTAARDVWVEGDRSRMKQVVVNLLDNAIKYTHEGGSVGLTVSARENKAILEVSDNGIGIPAESLPLVFERFFRVDEARSRGLGGAGLGLSIVKSICAAHHGNVEALSTPGHGSIFRVELPLVSHIAKNPNGERNNGH